MNKWRLRRIIFAPLAFAVGCLLLTSCATNANNRSQKVSQFAPTPYEEAREYCEQLVGGNSHSSQKKMGDIGMSLSSSIATSVNPNIGLPLGVLGMVVSGSARNRAQMAENDREKEIARCLHQQLQNQQRQIRESYTKKW